MKTQNPTVVNDDVVKITAESIHKMYKYKREHGEPIELKTSVSQDVFDILKKERRIIAYSDGRQQFLGWPIKVVLGYPAGWICVE